MGYNRGFLSVAVADMQGNVYSYAAASRIKNITGEEARRIMAFERALGLWGKAFWHVGADGLLHVDRAVFDMGTMEMMGVVSVGIDPALLGSRFQGILNRDISGVVLLNADGRILLESDPSGSGPAVPELPPGPEQGGRPTTGDGPIPWSNGGAPPENSPSSNLSIRASWQGSRSGSFCPWSTRP
jgi:hypothetical protein